MTLTLKLIVSFSTLILLLVVLPWQEVRQAVGYMSWPVWFAVLAGFICGHGLGIVKWRMMVNTGQAVLAPLDAIRCYAAGLFANLCLPSIVGGDVLRAVLAGKACGRPEAVVFGGVADRLIDIASMGILIAAGGMFAGHALAGWQSYLLVIGIIVLGGAGLACLPFILRRPLKRWPKGYRRRIGRSLVALRRLWRRPGTALNALALSLMIQSGFVICNAWIGHSIGIEVSLATWFLVWPLAKVAGLMPISLGGLGVRDAMLATLLLPFGVPAALGWVASLLWQTILFSGGALGGLIWWVLGAGTQDWRWSRLVTPERYVTGNRLRSGSRSNG